MWKVLTTVRARPQPSFYSVSNKDANAGNEFDSIGSQTVAENINEVSYSVTWEKRPSDGYWVPRNHYNDGTVYLQEVPISGQVAPNRTIIELNDGSVWEATEFTQIS